MKKIFIVNGRAGAGKDTFIDTVNEIVPSLKYSIIDSVKYIAEDCGWEDGKSEKDRKFLSDFKILLENYNDLPFREVQSIVRDFNSEDLDEFDMLFLIMREKKDIERAVEEFGAKTIFIKRDIEQVTSNIGDAGVMEYDKYDYIIDNTGDIAEMVDEAQLFFETVCDEIAREVFK